MAQAPVSLLFSDQTSSDLTGTATPLVYTMYLMPIQILMGMEGMTAHQELSEKGKLVPYEREFQARVIFISGGST